MSNEIENLFQMLSQANKPEPKFKVGDMVYWTKVDMVLKCKVVNIEDINDKDGCFDRYAYYLKYGDDTFRIWSEQDYKWLFANYNEAAEKAIENIFLFEKFILTKPKVLKCRIFRDCNDFKKYDSVNKKEPVIRYSYVVLCKDNTVIYKLPHKYAFAKRLCEEEAEKFYKNNLQSIIETMEDINSSKYRNSDDFTEIDDFSVINKDYYRLSNVFEEYGELDYFYNNVFKKKY